MGGELSWLVYLPYKQEITGSSLVPSIVYLLRKKGLQDILVSLFLDRVSKKRSV